MELKIEGTFQMRVTPIVLLSEESINRTENSSTLPGFSLRAKRVLNSLPNVTGAKTEVIDK